MSWKNWAFVVNVNLPHPAEKTTTPLRIGRNSVEVPFVDWSDDDESASRIILCQICQIW